MLLNLSHANEAIQPDAKSNMLNKRQVQIPRNIVFRGTWGSVRKAKHVRMHIPALFWDVMDNIVPRITNSEADVYFYEFVAKES